SALATGTARRKSVFDRLLSEGDPRSTNSERFGRSAVNTHPGIIGTKIGMTQIFADNGDLIPCTVIQGGCVVVGKRTQEKDGYDALIVGLGQKKEKRASKALRTAFEKVGQKTPQHVRE